MESESEDRPTSEKIQAQLEKLLASATFRASRRHSDIIAYLVGKERRGKDVSEMDILYDLFPSYVKKRLERETDIARVTVTQLRKRLQAYYSGEGERDAVVIEIPPNTYQPRYSFNRFLPANVSYEKGIYYLSHEFRINAPRTAHWNFKRAVSQHPTFAGAQAALSEALLIDALTDGRFEASSALQKAEEAASKTIALQSRLCLPYLVLGAIQCCRWKWSEAATLFEKAEAVSKNETMNSLWYWAYRLAVSCDGLYMPPLTPEKFTGMYPATKPVLEAVRAVTKPHIGDSFARALCTVFLYATRHFDDRVHNFEREDWLSLTVMNLASRAAHQDERRVPRPWTDEELLGFFSSNTFMGYSCPGLGIILAAFMSSDDAMAHERLARLIADAERSYVRPLQLALGHMALGEEELAIRNLEAACEEGDPFLAWMHLWPVLDPLRNLNGFRRLIDRMELPKKA
jgi:hypothetical protein